MTTPETQTEVKDEEIKDFLKVEFKDTDSWTYQIREVKASNGKVYEVSAWVKKGVVDATIRELDDNP